MRSISGNSFTGDRTKFSISLELGGMDKDHYQVGDNLKGRILVTPSEDVEIEKIILALDYVLASKDTVEVIHIHSAALERGKKLIEGNTYTFNIGEVNVFHRANFSGKYMSSYWEAKVLVGYDSRQFQKNYMLQAANPFNTKRPYGIAFKIPVKYNKGTYRTVPQELPISLIDGRSFFVSAILLMAILIFSLNFLGSSISWIKVLLSGLMCWLIGMIFWHYFWLNTFQLTPMEIQPLRDGQLRVRLLDRGNDHLAKAEIGYRVIDFSVTAGPETNRIDKVILLEKTFKVSEVARRMDHLYEVVLPWPDQQLPTSLETEKGGYRWELFFRVPNALTGGVSEQKWPMEVGWEPFRLPAEPPESLALPLLAKDKIPLKG